MPLHPFWSFGGEESLSISLVIIIKPALIIMSAWLLLWLPRCLLWLPRFPLCSPISSLLWVFLRCPLCPLRSLLSFSLPSTSIYYLSPLCSPHSPYPRSGQQDPGSRQVANHDNVRINHNAFMPDHNKMQALASPRVHVNSNDQNAQSGFRI